MAAPYAPDASLLSTAALALDGAVLDGYAHAAAEVLGLWGVTLTGTPAERASRAVALQVNHMLAQPEGEAVSEGRGARSTTYATTQSGRRVSVDAAAKAIADALLLSTRYTAVGSFR